MIQTRKKDQWRIDRTYFSSFFLTVYLQMGTCVRVMPVQAPYVCTMIRAHSPVREHASPPSLPHLFPLARVPVFEGLLPLVRISLRVFALTPLLGTICLLSFASSPPLSCTASSPSQPLATLQCTLRLLYPRSLHMTRQHVAISSTAAAAQADGACAVYKRRLRHAWMHALSSQTLLSLPKHSKSKPNSPKP
ncbi:hypothetical protein BJV74DRAFT_402858 [Russula compacta]|nr:hypothetical protein BJV74DRAFT_402858 [Russula compacta]